MRGQLRFLRESGFDVRIVSSPGEFLERAANEENVSITPIPMAREITLISDLRAFGRIIQTIHRWGPVITNVNTPKAGLLGGMAAWLARIPCRVYTLRGIRSETLTGPKGWVVWLTEVIACRCAHRVICVSESLRKRAIALRLVDEDHAAVIGSGSSNGVDANRFAPTRRALQVAEELRERLGIPQAAPVIGFAGRFTRDKGVPELLDAYLRLRQNFPDLRLLLLGATEEGDRLPQQSLDTIANDTKIICPGFVEDAAPYYHVMDVLTLPTHREGFPNVILEAHAAAKPVVAARATGAVDAVIDGVDGILVPVGDVVALAKALERVLNDKALAASMGRAGRKRVLREFQQERIWSEMIKEYSTLLRKKGLWLPEKSTPASMPNLVSDREAIGS